MQPRPLEFTAAFQEWHCFRVGLQRDSVDTPWGLCFCGVPHGKVRFHQVKVVHKHSPIAAHNRCAAAANNWRNSMMVGDIVTAVGPSAMSQSLLRPATLPVELPSRVCLRQHFLDDLTLVIVVLGQRPLRVLTDIASDAAVASSPPASNVMQRLDPSEIVAARGNK